MESATPGVAGSYFEEGTIAMRKLVAGAFVTMDGVMQAPGGPDEDHDGGFEHGGWLVPHFDETLEASMAAWVQGAGGFVLGRRTYEIFAGSWPNATDPDDLIAAALNQRPKYVASRTLKTLDWQNSTVLKGDVVEAVRGLKAEDGGELQVHGSTNLLQTLLKHDLVDTLRIWQFPVVIGKGKRLFGAGAIPATFELVETHSTPKGAVLHVYERAGALGHGIVEVGQETVVFDGPGSR
jgi:dihydrofolate reductase